MDVPTLAASIQTADLAWPIKHQQEREERRRAVGIASQPMTYD